MTLFPHLRRYEWSQFPVTIPLENGGVVEIRKPWHAESPELANSGILSEIEAMKGYCIDER